MTVAELQAEIIRLKKEKNICILAHAYQGHEIQIGRASCRERVLRLV